MGLSIWQLLLVAVFFVLLFGRGRIPGLMADVAAGIRSFRSELNSESELPQSTSDTEARAGNGSTTLHTVENVATSAAAHVGRSGDPEAAADGCHSSALSSDDGAR